MKKYFRVFIRLFITAILLFFLFKKIDLILVLKSLSQINPFVFFFVSFLYITASYISTLRWKIFLPNIDIKTSNLFSLYLIGAFFNTALPGIIGGDVVKIIMIKNKSGLKEAVASVFMERYTGFLALLTLGFIFFIVFYRKLPDNLLIWIVPLLFFISLSSSILIYLSSNIKIKFIRDFHEHILSFSKRQIALALLYSIFVQFIVIFSVYILNISLNLSIPFFELVIFLPIIILITMIPISISGIGVREWCFILFFGESVGHSELVSLSFLWFLATVTASLIGGLEYLKFKNLLNLKNKKQSF